MLCPFCHKPLSRPQSRRCDACHTSFPRDARRHPAVARTRIRRPRYLGDPDENGYYSNARKSLEM